MDDISFITHNIKHTYIYLHRIAEGIYRLDIRIYVNVYSYRIKIYMTNIMSGIWKPPMYRRLRRLDIKSRSSNQYCTWIHCT
jgi:hypothetical protein